MKKSRRVLDLNKLVISKLNDPMSIIGGTGQIIVEESDIDMTRQTKNPAICPTGTGTCPETFYFSCAPCGSQIITDDC